MRHYVRMIGLKGRTESGQYERGGDFSLSVNHLICGNNTDIREDRKLTI